MLKVSQVTPKGVLTFFKDSASLSRFVDQWKKVGLFARIEDVKPCAIEHSDPGEMRKALKKYYDNVDVDGSNLFLTMKGKCADSIIFKDHMARAVVIIGAPFPDAADPSFKAKLNYFSQNSQSMLRHSRDEAVNSYSNEIASGVVNRLISLPIKHINDYGAVILVGKEYESGHLLNYLPVWATANLHPSNDSQSFIPNLFSFFQSASKSQVKNLHLIPKNKSESEQLEKSNQALIQDNYVIRHKLPNTAQRKFVALNKDRRKDQEELLARLEKEKEAALSKMQEESPHINENPEQVCEAKLEDEILEKQMSKVKTNPLPQIPKDVIQTTGGGCQDEELTISYIPNTEKLRDKNNSIQLAKILQNRDPRSRIMCNICYESDNKRFLVSKCGHISCEICWEIRLRDLMECPICKQKVRRKTLIEIVSE